MQSRIPHLLRELRFCWSWTLLDMDLIDRYNKQLSENRRTAVCGSITLGRSLINHKKSKGPSMVPCRTMKATVCDSPRSPPVVSWLSERSVSRREAPHVYQGAQASGEGAGGGQCRMPYWNPTLPHPPAPCNPLWSGGHGWWARAVTRKNVYYGTHDCNGWEYHACPCVNGHASK